MATRQNLAHAFIPLTRPVDYYHYYILQHYQSDPLQRAYEFNLKQSSVGSRDSREKYLAGLSMYTFLSVASAFTLDFVHASACVGFFCLRIMTDE